ncbi:WAT1-related-like protein isoform X1 [Cinnamomum micranthum f. kanehirae]|uniref:WAT1-related protein n=1 Tax=Cinnamomum micranthum f. kanehirae TaxID=337451 RepID=A0A3S3NQT6_9MAGN|nr:WAT1-related-like protein isoform X1 [Cinnamomum micranthum f. kanehirae]
MASSSLGNKAQKIAPHACLVMGQIITASYIVLSKVILVQGISSSVFLVYQFILATVFIATLSFIFERRKRPPLTKQILGWIFLLALIGVTLAQSMLAGALYFTSSTVESSVLNMIPAITYILSLISRQEKLEIHTSWGKGKIFGTLMSVSGALTLMLWHGSGAQVMSTSMGNYLVGLVMVVVGVVAFSTWILMLEPVTKRYPAELSMTAIMFFFATLQTSVIAAILSHKASKWQLKWDLELLNIFIGGALNSGLANFFVAICARLKGPVFVSSFSPLGPVVCYHLGVHLSWPSVECWKHCRINHDSGGPLHLSVVEVQGRSAPIDQRSRFDHHFSHIRSFPRPGTSWKCVV